MIYYNNSQGTNISVFLVDRSPPDVQARILDATGITITTILPDLPSPLQHFFR